MNTPSKKKIVDMIGKLIFTARWGLVPIYLGLYVGVVAYTWKFAQEVWHLLSHIGGADESDILLVMIGLIDMSMIANLIVMTMIGGYSIFVREYDYENLPDKPRWMHGFNTTVQKVKMGMSLIAISSVYLLKSFIEAETVTWDTLLKQCLIIGVFCFLTICYGVIARTTPHDHDDHIDHTKKEH